MDVDGDGTIEYSEFISATTKTHILLTEQRLTKVNNSMMKCSPPNGRDGTYYDCTK